MYLKKMVPHLTKNRNSEEFIRHSVIVQDVRSRASSAIFNALPPVSLALVLSHLEIMNFLIG